MISLEAMTVLSSLKVGVKSNLNIYCRDFLFLHLYLSINIF